MRLIVSAAALGLAMFAAQPAAAQEAGGEKVNQLVIYGDDPCPESVGDEITVCARKDESERYRIPEELRGSDSPQGQSWTNRVKSYEMVGSTGTRSCSPAGAGGWTGCLGQFIDTAYAEKKENPGIKFSEMIAAERAKRLETIDADAAETQARVEQAEKEYEARERAQGDPADKAEETAPPAPTPPKP